MIDRKKEIHPTSGSDSGISEAERMAKIRELLVGPVLADESARVDESFAGLKELVEKQSRLITNLESRILELEDGRRADRERVRLGLFGIAESLLADEEEMHSRIIRNDVLRAKFEAENERE